MIRKETQGGIWWEMRYKSDNTALWRPCFVLILRAMQNHCGDFKQELI